MSSDLKHKKSATETKTNDSKSHFENSLKSATSSIKENTKVSDCSILDSNTTSILGDKSELQPIDAIQQEQSLNSTRKFGKDLDRHLLDGSKIVGELNNNSLLLPIGMSSSALQAIRMDHQQNDSKGAKLSKLNNTNHNRPATASTETAITIESDSSKPGDSIQSLDPKKTSINNQTPSYNSIFDQSIKRSNQQQSQQFIASTRTPGLGTLRGRLRKQNAESGIDIDLPSFNRYSNDKKLAPFSYTNSLVSREGEVGGDIPDEYYDDDSNREVNSYDDDEEEDEDDDVEKFPLSSSSSTKQRPLTISKNKSNKRISPENYSKQSSSSGKRSMQANENNYRSDPHTKISINDNRRHSTHSHNRSPSFITCKADRYGKLNSKNSSWRDYPAHQCQYSQFACDCNQCFRKHKLALNEFGRHEDWDRTRSKTKSIHLVLKSIILVLLTLLLLMLFIGMIAASHYLPQVFDRLVNVSRSFNVTIAG